MSTRLVIALALVLLSTPPIAHSQRAAVRADSVERKLARFAPAAIRISEPAKGKVATPAGTTVAVRATAGSTTEIEWLELWANDGRVGLQPAPKGGLKVLTGVFAWTPDTPGTYSLIARAVDREDRTVTSAAVDVIVDAATEPRTGPDNEAHKRQTSPENGVGSERITEPAVVRFERSDELSRRRGASVAAERWKPGEPARRTGRSASLRPGPTLLSASTEECRVTLNIQETTGRAEGFAVYRQSATGAGWTRAAVLHGAAAGSGLTFTDGAAPGRQHYYVSAFTDRGETVSNPVAIDVDAAKCRRTRTEGGTRVLKHNPPPIQEHPYKKMPEVTARISNNVEACKNHLPGKGTNALEAILFCTPFPELDAKGKQPYLVWSVDDGVCANGKVSNGADCDRLTDLVSRAQTYGGHVGYRLTYTHKNGPLAGVGYPGIATLPHDRTSYVIPPLEPYDVQANEFNFCNVEVEYEVELFYDAGPNDPDFAHLMLVGPLKGGAEWLSTCPPAPPDEVALDLRIGTLHLGNLDDGDSGTDDDVEVYGFFRIWTAKTDVPVPAFALQSGLFKKVGYRGFGAWGKAPEDCPSEQFDPGALHSSTSGLCHRSLHAGDHAVSQFLLCDTCTGPSHTDVPFSKNKNTVRIAVKDGEAVYIETLVIDYDSGSADDAQCVGVVNTERHLVDTWAKFDEELMLKQKYNGNGSCTVTFRITAVN
jgi:hypothetical protein